MPLDPLAPGADATARRAGWPNPGAPGGRVLPLDLADLDEKHLLGPGGAAAIRPLGRDAGDYHPERDPLLLVHGILGAPKDLQAVVARFAASPFQLYVLCYDDFFRHTSQNGVDLAAALRGLVPAIGRGRRLSIVAHSLGGIVTRAALNQLAASPARGIEDFSLVHVMAVDVPWHGFMGPSDRGLDGLLAAASRPFMPDGMEDMRAASAFFQGDPGSADPVTRAGLLGVEPAEQVKIEPVFAERGGVALDYTEPPVSDLVPRLVRHYLHDEPIAGDARMMNFWRAILWSYPYYPFQQALRDRADAGQLTEDDVRRAFAQHFPRFPGDHTSVLAEQPGAPSLLDHLAARLR